MPAVPPVKAALHSSESIVGCDTTQVHNTGNKDKSLISTSVAFASRSSTSARRSQVSPPLESMQGTSAVSSHHPAQDHGHSSTRFTAATSSDTLTAADKVKMASEGFSVPNTISTKSGSLGGSRDTAAYIQPSRNRFDGNNSSSPEAVSAVRLVQSIVGLIFFLTICYVALHSSHLSLQWIMGTSENRTGLVRRTLAITAPLSSLALALSPILIFINTFKAANPNTSSIPINFFYVTAFTNLAGEEYGRRTPSPPVLFTNTVSFCLQVLWISLYFYVRSNARQGRPFSFIPLALQGSTLMAALWVFLSWLPLDILGIGMAACNVILCSTPLIGLPEVLAMKNAAKLAPPILLILLIQNGLWALYGFLTDETVIWVPSVLGYIIVLIQLYVVIGIVKESNISNGTKTSSTLRLLPGASFDLSALAYVCHRCTTTSTFPTSAEPATLDEDGCDGKAKGSSMRAMDSLCKFVPQSFTKFCSRVCLRDEGLTSSSSLSSPSPSHVELVTAGVMAPPASAVFGTARMPQFSNTASTAGPADKVPPRLSKAEPSRHPSP